MRIEQITLYNFGSYEGKAVFDTKTDGTRNIILIGGKNGAGKTTLFTAMRLCLYGYMSMGYRSQNAYYFRSVSKLLNSSAKLVRPTKAHVQMQIALSNGHELDIYRLTRAWVLRDTLSETFCVEKNGSAINSGEVADFEKYLLSMIPPELFNFYFFDGEKIADFFLDEAGSTRIKEAFLTLCGYDVFDIMRKNFHRVSSAKGNSSPNLQEYLTAKENADRTREVCQTLSDSLRKCEADIELCVSNISALEKEYRKKGGITQNEWEEKRLTQREEEKKREALNTAMKKWANDLIPFLMIRDRIAAVKEQIEGEASDQKYRNFCEVLDSPEISQILAEQLPTLKEIAAKRLKHGNQPLLNLSLEQNATVLAQIKQILEFDKKEIFKCKRAIKRSLALSASLRQELENSSLSSEQEYMLQRAQLYEAKSRLLEQKVKLKKQLQEQEEIFLQAKGNLSNKQSRLEAELKRVSIDNISARAIVMLDKLQKVLYRCQVERVETIFRREINTLMRKKRFIDDIQIDDRFQIHIYRVEDISRESVAAVLTGTSGERLRTLLGNAAMEKLRQFTGTDDPDGMAFYCRSCGQATIALPVEIDKASLSNGEKQIFIMALYYSLAQLSGHEIPFIIDTPFARIDTEHRKNISQYFFKKLAGQVFILSTNEEIDSDHVQILKDHIASVYLLESTDEKRTTVVKNSYFEVPHGF